MSGLSWTKFQDFYLRLGFLKVLVAVLSPERRSATAEAIIRRLESPLFDSTKTHESLSSRALELLADAYPRRTSSGKIMEYPEIAEALLAVEQNESALYGITRDTTYKILDWGRNVQLVGRANQITERGLLLRSLWPSECADRFLAGELDAWRPLVLTLRERLFFLFHLEEIDALTIALIADVGRRPDDTIIETREAARLTSRALFRVLIESERTLPARDIPNFRIAQELAITIAKELDEPIPPPWTGVARQAEVRNVRGRSKPAQPATKARKTTKGADHQTIPRFEQLVDLGFLVKPAADAQNEIQALAARRRWRYVPTGLCRRWSAARTSLIASAPSDLPFRWDGFARSAVAAIHARESSELIRPPMRVVGQRLWSAYTSVRRTVGLSPVDSISLIGMIDSVVDGLCIEMSDFHYLLLKIQQRGDLADCVHFASGKALDKMFIQLKPSFPHRFAEIADQLEDADHHVR